MRTRRLLFVVPSLLGGLVLALAFPPFSAPLTAPLGIATFALAAGDRGVRRGLVAGLAFGLVFFGVTLWWLASSIAPAAWVAVTAAQAAWLAAAGAGIALLRHLPAWPVWAACWWTTIESARSAVPWGGMPWGRLGYSAVDTPWQGLLPALGVVGTGTVVALLGTSLAAVVAAVNSGRPVLQTTSGRVSAGVVAALLFAGAVTGAPAIDPATPVAHVGIVQGGVPGDGTEVARNHRAVTARHLAETRALARLSTVGRVPDLVVWPENATAVDPDRDAEARQALTAAVEAVGVPVLVGAITDAPDPSRARNQGIVWTTSGASDRYTKQHLVPFGEFVPLRPIAETVSSRVADIQRDMVPGGADPRPLQVGALRVADALCFDVAYDDTVRGQVAQGADLVVVQTSNAMFLGTSQPDQQWAVTRARAIEVGRSVVVSSINGVSGAIAADGSVIERLPSTRTASTVVAVPIVGTTTLATRLGGWPARVIWLAGAIGILLVFGGRLRARSSKEY